jgi:hypothetical protein
VTGQNIMFTFSLPAPLLSDLAGISLRRLDELVEGATASDAEYAGMDYAAKVVAGKGRGGTPA